MTDVTFDAQPVGGATVDVWQDAGGTTRWFVRVLMPSLDLPSSGQLGGRTLDGRLLQGLVEFVGQGPTLRVRGPVLVEWRGVGSLGAVESAPEG